MEFEIALRLRNQWQYVVVDGKTLADARQLTELGNYDAIINATDRLKQFFDALRACNPDLPQIKTYKQTGWTDSDCTTFAYPTGNNEYIVRRAGYDYEEIFKPKGNPELWKKKFCEVTEQGGAIAHAVIGTACAAPLVRPLELPNLQLHIEGKKSIGKTPLLQFALSIYGDSSIRGLTRTFAATPKSRLEFATAFSDLPVILEELETLGKKDAEHLPQDVYNYSLGIGGQALNKDGTKRETKEFSGARLTSGEHSIVQSSDNGGVYKRVLNLRCVKLLDEDFASELYGFCKHNRGLFGKKWTKYVAKNHDLIGQHYHKALSTFLAKQRGTQNARDDTQLRTLVIALVAYQHFKNCIGLSDLATETNAINTELERDINAIIRTLPTAAEMDDTARAIEFLKSFVAGSEKYFWRTIKNSNTGRKEDICHYTADGYGKFFEDGEIAFLPHALKMILEEKGGFKSADKLIAEFGDKGYLRSRNGSYRYPSWIDGKTTKTVRFFAGVLSDTGKANTARTETA